MFRILSASMNLSDQRRPCLSARACDAVVSMHMCGSMHVCTRGHLQAQTRWLGKFEALLLVPARGQLGLVLVWLPPHLGRCKALVSNSQPSQCVLIYNFFLGLLSTQPTLSLLSG